MNLNDAQSALRMLAINDPERLISWLRPQLSPSALRTVADVEKNSPTSPRTGIAARALKEFLRAAGDRAAIDARTIATATSLLADEAHEADDMKATYLYAGEKFTFTAAHPASSYGQPILLGPDGHAYGPADEIQAAADDPLAWMPRESGLAVACSIRGQLRRNGEEAPEILNRFIALGFAICPQL